MHARSAPALLIAAALLAPPVAAARVVRLLCRDGIPPPRLLCAEGCPSRPVRCDVDDQCNGVCTFAIRVCGEVACVDRIFAVPAGQRQKIALATALGAKPTRFVLRCLPHPPRLPCPVSSSSTTTTVATTSSTTLPGEMCQTDADCNDGNGCTHDACVNRTCVHVCICLAANGVPACCPGPAALCVRPCGSDASGACGGRCPSGATCEPVPGGTTCGCVSGLGGPCGGNIFAPPPVCATGLVCQQSNPDATGVCVATTTTTLPCIPFFEPGCTLTSVCCQPCGAGIIEHCAVCLQGECVGAP